MAEFTGERVVPGQVEADLWNEHFSRYVFASRFVAGRRVLDAGCGTGYGSAELARSAASAIGLDVAVEAVEFARRHFAEPQFVNGSAAAFPFRAGAFDVVVSFEMIEHLREQAGFLAECRRVLAANGLLIVSTPNKLYYAEARAGAGPNPYHEHEFEFAEFEAAMRAQFAHVVLLVQNRSECFLFYPPAAWSAGETVAEAGADRVDEANFFIALCSNAPLPEIGSLAYLPRVTNLLREREQHIEKLQRELAQKEKWLAEVTAERDRTLELMRETEAALEKANQWAEETAAALSTARERIIDLQERFAEAQAQAQAAINALEAENRKKTEWALALGAEVDVLRGQIAMVVASRWVRAGHKIGLGPPLPGLDAPAQ